MTDRACRLREDATAIWRAGVAAADSARLIERCVRWADDGLSICDCRFRLGSSGKIVVVGGGKAGAGMATGFEAALADSPAAQCLTGWINVPSDCVRPLAHIHLHPARPAGINEPTEAGVAGSHEILRLVAKLAPEDLCVVLLSGGGSALLPAPIPGISLADKQAVTRFLMSTGATINELNCVRKHLSQIKGGNLARAASGARMIALVISDVVGDPLDVIASGPTVADQSSPADALAVLEKFTRDPRDVPAAIWSVLRAMALDRQDSPIADSVRTIVIGNNATALEASAVKAAAMGYDVRSLGSENQGIARELGRELATLGRTIRDSRPFPNKPVCVLSGGEPVVRLVPTSEPRRGGRNQELVLAAVAALWDDGLDGIALLSGGTDGEDGPTDAAGAVADSDLVHTARGLGLNPEPFLAINNSYAFFEQAGGLLKTGPTHTNVMDLRVLLIDQPPSAS